MFKRKGTVLKNKWHRFWLGYHAVILEGCLDEAESKKIEQKILYHELRCG
ncbi:hypothetical protein [Aneurinibacillus tyrosinisolvens]|nr:hypothetical protein [Aneurinibacillus tyrosinisolvens]